MKEKRIPVLATTTTSTVEEAGKIAAALVEKRLAACVQIVEGSPAYLSWLEKNIR